MEDEAAPETDEILDGFIGTAARRVILDERDAVLAENCTQMMEGWAGRRVAVRWGAAHIPQLVRFLVDKHGYTVAETTWHRVQGPFAEPAATLSEA